MREIKFRAWHTMLKKWDYFTLEQLVFFGASGGGWNVFEHIQQYTGLHDNTQWDNLTKKEQQDWLKQGNTKEQWNGKEIYEGDFLMSPDKRVAPIEWQVGAFWWLTKTLGDWCEHSVVIGNIHENPELLEEE